MDLSLDTPLAKYQILSYKHNEIKISNTEKIAYQQSVLLSCEHFSLLDCDNILELNSEHCDSILQLKPEIVLLGTGEHQVFIEPKIISILTNNQLGVEIMSSQAACNTFTILANEGRNVVAAIII